MMRGQLIDGGAVWPGADLETQLSQSANEDGGEYRVTPLAAFGLPSFH
jgi:hypothetical protein